MFCWCYSFSYLFETWVYPLRSLNFIPVYLTYDFLFLTLIFLFVFPSSSKCILGTFHALDIMTNSSCQLRLYQSYFRIHLLFLLGLSILFSFYFKTFHFILSIPWYQATITLQKLTYLSCSFNMMFHTSTCKNRTSQ